MVPNPKILSILFIMLYIIGISKPVLPFAEYMINKTYYLENCENLDKPELNCEGKCHLEEIEQKQTESNPISPNINMEEYPLGFLFDELIIHQDIFNIKKLLSYYSNNYSYDLSSNLFRPPILFI